MQILRYSPIHDRTIGHQRDRHLVAVVGEFDGMHRGHQQVVAAASRLATHNNAPLLGVIVDEQSTPSICQPVSERCASMIERGATGVLALSVDSFIDEAEDVARCVARYLGPTHVMVGDDPGRSASVAQFGVSIRQSGAEMVYADLRADHETRHISSAAVRTAIRNGALAEAEAMLGRSPEFTGLVVHGRGLGRTIGFATANLDLAPRQVLPPLGVYAACATLSDGSTHDAAVNIGVRPTVESHGAALVEAHLLDFDGDLYDSMLKLQLTARLRAERKFASLDDLIEQLDMDVANVRAASNSRPDEHENLAGQRARQRRSSV